MADMNKVFLNGKVVRDPKIYGTQNGGSIAAFSIGTSREYITRDGLKQKETHWPSLKAFGKNAEYVKQHVQKGTEIFVRGHIVTGSYTGKDGVKRYTTDVQVDSIEAVNGQAEAAPKQTNIESEYTYAGYGAEPEPLMDSADVPF